MRGISSKDKRANPYRGKRTCSFCRSPDHSVTDCQHVQPIWESLSQGIVPISYLMSVSPNDTKGDTRWRQNSYYRSPLQHFADNGALWGDLYKLAEKSWEKQQKAKARKNKRGSGSTNNRSCGYCGSKDHTRRSCIHLEEYKQRLVTANRNFRKWFYDKYVADMGLSTGCIVRYDTIGECRGSNWRETKWETTSRSAVVTEINWDSINLFALLPYRKVTYNNAVRGAKTEKLQSIQSFLSSPISLKTSNQADLQNTFSEYTRQSIDHSLSIPLNITGRSVFTPSGSKNSDNLDCSNMHILNSETLMPVRTYGSEIIDNVEVISRAPQILADDWVDGYSDEMSVIFKKFNKEQLEFFGVLAHIDEWYAKSI